MGLMGATALALVASACSGRGGTTAPADSQTGTGSTSDTSQGTATGDATSGDGKVLVAYYSAQGHTRRVAQAAADALGADIFEIVPQQPYADDDLNWSNDGSRVSREHEDESKRDVPLTQTTPDSWADYDVVLLGYPIWWGIAAWPTNHFASDNDFSGKTVIPFCTSASSGIGDSGRLLAQMAGSGDWQEGHRFSSGAEDSEVADWVAGLDL